MATTEINPLDQKLTKEEVFFNDYLQNNHPELMKEAYELFQTQARYYGNGYDFYGYELFGKAALHRDIYTLARLFENDYAEYKGITK